LFFWAKGLCPECEIYVAVNEKTLAPVQSALNDSGTKAKVLNRGDWNTAVLLEEMAKSAGNSSAKYVHIQQTIKHAIRKQFTFPDSRIHRNRQLLTAIS